MAGERPVLKTDLEEARFAFVANKISASVATDATLDGTGSTANPLSSNISSDADNIISLGGDGGIFGQEHTMFQELSAAVNAGPIDPVVTHTGPATPVVNIPANVRPQNIMVSILGGPRFSWTVGNTIIGDLDFELDTGAGFFVVGSFTNIFRSLPAGHTTSVQWFVPGDTRPIFTLASTIPGTVQGRLVFTPSAGVSMGTTFIYTLAIAVYAFTI